MKTIVALIAAASLARSCSPAYSADYETTQKIMDGARVSKTAKPRPASRDNRPALIDDQGEDSENPEGLTRKPKKQEEPRYAPTERQAKQDEPKSKLNPVVSGSLLGTFLASLAGTSLSVFAGLPKVIVIITGSLAAISGLAFLIYLLAKSSK